jgi:hypothetical protein
LSPIEKRGGSAVRQVLTVHDTGREGLGEPALRVHERRAILRSARRQRTDPGRESE